MPSNLCQKRWLITYAVNRAGQKEAPCPALFHLILHRLVNHTPDGIRCLPLHPLGSVGVGVQGETRAVVPQGVGEGFHVHAMLQ